MAARVPAQMQNGCLGTLGSSTCCAQGGERTSCRADRTVAPPGGLAGHTAVTEKLETCFPSGRRG